MERQRAACVDLAKSRGWEVDPARIWVENDTSATTGRRPKFAAMVAAAEAGTIDVIVAWHIDRLTRKLSELEDLIVLSERTGVKIATVSGDVDLTTDSGRLVGRILASVARGEVERKGARQRAANQQRAELGRSPHTGRAFGYNLDGTIREDEAEIVRTLFTRFAAGEGLHTLTRWLGENDVRNTRGKLWTRVGVRDVLLNPRYIAERWILRTRDGKRVREYIGPGDWEPIVSEDLFRAVGAILTDPARREFGARGNARLYVGAGCYVCGVCGTPLRTGYSTYKAAGAEKPKQYRIYVCPQGFHVSRRAEYIDDIVERVISRRLSDPAIASALTSDVDRAQVRALRDEANGLRSRIDGFANDLADGLLSARQVKVATDRATAKLREVEAKLAQIGSSSALGGLLGSADPGAAWLALEDPRAKGAVINALCEVRVHRQPRGRRPSDRNPEKLAAWWEQIASTIEFAWHK
ncbi:hypothetical protein ASD19_10820 [Microbacterium sp. Root53]|nr:hypothetical protein ASD19_10820 [Microbacterium sp. Root53]